ncbi:MAG: cell division protein FtsK, partial [Bradyrhizobium sp.]
DAEVEKIVTHLKAQGQPEYLSSITEEDPDEDVEAAPAGTLSTMDAEEAGDYYDRAVNIVLRDRKCSTSYIQRRLSVGYNKAASLVERMEQEGVVSAANHAGKREILVGNGVDRAPFEEDE